MAVNSTHTMMACAAVLVVVLAAAGLSLCSTTEEWLRWKMQHEKRYASDEEEDARMRIWQHNHRLIAAHNLANHSYSLALNHFADLVRMFLV